MFAIEPLETLSFAKFSATISVNSASSHTDFGVSSSLLLLMLFPLRVRFRRPPYDFAGMRVVGGQTSPVHIDSTRRVDGFDS
jgi:hypothetical protein